MRDDIIAAFENAKTNATTTGQVYWHTLTEHPSVSFGFDPDEDYFFLAMAPSNGPHTEWEQITAVFERRRATIPGLSSIFESALCIRFNTDMFIQSKNIIDFIVDLIEGLDVTDINTSFEAVLAEWESMFAMFGTPLNPKQVRGLIGELLVLNHLLDNQGIAVADSWIGPTGTLHDFICSDWHIEVKESMRPDPMASVHPIDQLEPIDVPFNLVMIKLRRDDSGFSLPDLIDIIREKIGSGNGHRVHFEDVLLAAGYRDDHSFAYIDFRYSSELEIRLPINEDANVLFPAMISSNVNYVDIRWKLRMSQHPFINIDDDFWTNPGI